MSFETVVQKVRLMTLEERKRLLNLIVDSFIEEGRTRSLLEFEGLGEPLREDLDAQEHVNQLRNEWDHRP